MITVVIITLLSLLAAVAFGLIVRLVVYGVDACIRYNHSQRNPWGSRSAEGFSGDITVDSLHDYYTQIGKNDIIAMDGVSIDDCCSVCLESLGDSLDLVRLNSCNHVFHRPCIDEWLLTHPLCPLCKRDIRDVRNNGERRLGEDMQTVSITISVASSRERRTISSSHTVSFHSCI